MSAVSAASRTTISSARTCAGVGHSLLLSSALVASALLLSPTLMAAAQFHAPVALAADTPTIATADESMPMDFAAFVPLADIDALRSDIEGLVERGDGYSPARAELALELGKALQDSGEHTAALQAFDEAQQVLRRQEGLFSTAQVNVLQARIDSELALGNVEAADVLHAALFSMQQQLFAAAPGELADAHLQWADWNASLYLQARAQVLPGGRSDAAFELLDARLGRAFAAYHKGRSLLQSLEDSADPAQLARKVGTERRIAALVALANAQYRSSTPNLLTKFGMESAAQQQRSNHPLLLEHGSKALQRALSYSKSSAEPQQVAQRLLELADWYRLMHQYEEAQGTYAEAAALLAQSGVTAARQQRILQGGMPVHDPVAELQALLTQDEIAVDGYVDVAFDVDARGRARNARVLASSEDDPRLAEDLLRRVRNDAFRPGFADGQPLPQQAMTLRYYFSRQ